jgi:hypothetical protein
VKNLLYCF